MSPEYWYTDREAAGVEDSLRAVPAEREHAARMIGLQRRVITELRSRRDAQDVRIVALEESLRAAKQSAERWRYARANGLIYATGSFPLRGTIATPGRVGEEAADAFIDQQILLGNGRTPDPL